MKFQFHSKIGLPKIFFQTNGKFFKRIKKIFNKMAPGKKYNLNSPSHETRQIY